MSVPKSVIKFKKGDVIYTSSVDRVKYTIQELTRGALRDVGKYMRSQYRTTFHSMLKRRSGLAGSALQYWVRKQEGDLQIGLWKTKKPAKGFWGGFYEIGNAEHNIPKLGIMKKTVMNNIQKIIEIESQYLSELSKDDPDLSGLSEDEYESDES